MNVSREEILELLKYFTIIETYTNSKEEDFTAEKLEQDLNEFLDAMSKKYLKESEIWYIMQMTEDEQIFFVCSAILFRKHDIIVKVNKVENGKGLYIRFKGENKNDVTENVIKNNVDKPYL